MEALDLSVIIGAHNAVRSIPHCLAALGAQLPGLQYEVIVATSGTDGTSELVAQQFPSVRLLRFEPTLTLPFLRGHAIAHSRGRVVAILDAYSIPAPEWANELLKVHREHPNYAIGGAVELYRSESRTLTAWAIYLNEYGGFMPPLVEGTVTILPGSNISYKREALGDVSRFARQGFWKTFFNSDLETNSHPLWLAPSVVVQLFKPIPFGDFLRTRFHHGRCYAAMRVASATPFEKLWRSVSAPILPAIFLWRQLRQGLAKQQCRRQLLRTLPLQVLLFVSWSWGELCGYAAGVGDSPKHLLY